LIILVQSCRSSSNSVRFAVVQGIDAGTTIFTNTFKILMSS